MGMIAGGENTVMYMTPACKGVGKGARIRVPLKVYSTGVQSKDRISPVFSFFMISQLATLIRD